MKVITHAGKTLLTPSQYAKKKKVHRLTVYNHINADKIEVSLIGMNEDIYINWDNYKNHKFQMSKKRR